jgi:kynurenine formamidase
VARFDSPNDRIDWKYVWLTVSALRYLIEQMDEENIKGVFIDTFAMTNFYGKVLLYEAILLSQ